jgi:hypothetical protein
MAVNKINYVGMRFGKLTVVEDLGRKSHDRLLLCRCDCGKQTEAIRGNLKSGNTKSCGCGVYRAEDLTGNVYGWLTVVKMTRGMTDRGRPERPRFTCQCQCGAEVVTNGVALRNGHIKACPNCRRTRMRSLPSKGIDLTGMKFGRWTVVGLSTPAFKGRKLYRVKRYLCQCECGKRNVVPYGNLTRGFSRSCGCLRSDRMRNGIGKVNVNDQQCETRSE